MTVIDALERIDARPDVIALSGLTKDNPGLGDNKIGAGYSGGDTFIQRTGSLGGAPVRLFSSSHVRSHILTAAGLAPADDATQRAALVWEGAAGSFFLLDERWNVTRQIPVMNLPGHRYAMLFAIAHPGYPDDLARPYNEDSGKLMALAAYGDPGTRTSM